jgi:putative phosphoribosyl transferase
VQRFRDRRRAGQRLAEELRRIDVDDPVVLGLPRGGVPVAAEVAADLGAQLDVLIVRKLGVPYQPELAFGAIGEGGVVVFNDRVLRGSGLDDNAIEDVRAAEQVELERRAELYRGGRAPLDISGRTVLIIDDGIATGATVRAACMVARAHGAQRVVVATPVGAADSLAALRDVADEVIAVHAVRSGHFGGVGQFYDDFDQTSDDEVTELLGFRP